MKITGIILIAIGIAMLVFRGFSFTQEKKVADIGPIEINKKEEKSIGWPMYAGALAMAVGVFMVLSKKRS
jgi:uncharacterized membrane protein HdeD (DUF308 family)